MTDESSSTLCLHVHVHICIVSVLEPVSVKVSALHLVSKMLGKIMGPHLVVMLS